MSSASKEKILSKFYSSCAQVIYASRVTKKGNYHALNTSSPWFNLDILEYDLIKTATRQWNAGQDLFINIYMCPSNIPAHQGLLVNGQGVDKGSRLLLEQWKISYVFSYSHLKYKSCY